MPNDISSCIRERRPIYRHTMNYKTTFFLPGDTQEGVMSVEKVVYPIQVTVLLPLSRNSSSHVTVSIAPDSTGNVPDVFRYFQPGSNPEHSSEEPVQCLISFEKCVVCIAGCVATCTCNLYLSFVYSRLNLRIIWERFGENNRITIITPLISIVC